MPLLAVSTSSLQPTLWKGSPSLLPQVSIADGLPAKSFSTLGYFSLCLTEEEEKAYYLKTRTNRRQKSATYGATYKKKTTRGHDKVPG